MTDFFPPAAKRVYEKYEKRNQDELALQKSLPPGEGFARRDEFLLPLGKDAATAIHALIVALGAKTVLELGTSYGYSTLFLADAVRRTGGRVITMELDERKQAHARNMLDEAELAHLIDWRCGDAVAMIGEEIRTFDFVLLDIWKELYVPCLEAFYPKLADEGVIAADNMIYPPVARADVRLYRAALHTKPDLRTTLLPIGSGVELSVKWPADSDKL